MCKASHVKPSSGAGVLARMRHFKGRIPARRDGRSGRNAGETFLTWTKLRGKGRCPILLVPSLKYNGMKALEVGLLMSLLCSELIGLAYIYVIPRRHQPAQSLVSPVATFVVYTMIM